MFKKIKSILNRLKIGLALGMKTADEQLMHNDNVADDVNGGVHQQQSDHRVAKHLLKGEVTQETEELRWRTMKIDRESREYEYFSPLKGVKRQRKNEGRKLNIYNYENYKVLTVQENKGIGNSVYDALGNINPNTVSMDKNGELNENIGRLEKTDKYLITISRNNMFTPRYLLEEYTKKVVCFTVNEEKNSYIVDFYVTKYPNDKDRKSKGFVREIEYIKNDKRRSDVIDIKGVEFVTEHAYNFYDGIFFKFNKLKFKNIVEYDGNYIIRFSGEVVENGKDFFNEDQCESMKRKYEEKAAKECVVNFDPYNTDDIRMYKCSICGKAVSYNQLAIDEKAPSEETDRDGVTEYMDMETSEQTFGKKICKDCMEKHKAEIMEEYLKTLSNDNA
jgi:hypothetical protein